MVLSLTDERLQEFIQPFIRRTLTVSAGEGNVLWRATRRNLFKNAVREFVRSLAGRPRHRSHAAVTEIYETSYSDGIAPLEESLDPNRAPRAFLFGQRQLVYMPTAGLMAAYLGAIGDMIAELKPASVCEVGFGSGKNLLSLAHRFPDISFRGYELTPAGVALARHLQEQPALPPNLASFIGGGSDFRRIDFRQGDASALPADDGSVDVTITVLALEQMSSIMPRALAEIRRITRKHVIFLEPFLDSNDWLGRMVLRSRDYLQMTNANLVAAGFRPRAVFNNLPQKLTFRAPLIVADVA